MNQSFSAFMSLAVACLLLVSCGKPSASRYAARFCACSQDFSKAGIQLKAGTIDQARFEQISTEHQACLGEDDPLKALEDKPAELIQFKAEFLTELEKQCPDVFRNLGFGD